MKYIKISFFIILFVSIFTLLVSADTNETYIFEYPAQNITVEFSDTSFLSEEVRQLIADSLVHGTPIPQTYSLCWLLGHDTITETISVVYHERSIYDPRCQLELYDVTSCYNCDYISPVLISSCYISCCPPETSAVSLD